MADKLKSMNFKKIERQTLFLGLAIAMSIIVVGFAIYAILSLAADLNEAVSAPTPVPDTVKFDIQGFRDLKLIR